jgi:glycerophosphoryl diester phosphodiesterase
VIQSLSFSNILSEEINNLKKYLFAMLGVALIFGIEVIVIKHVKSPVVTFRNTVSENRVMRHALGEIDGHIYTDSKEAFLNSFKNGNKLYEVDVNWTSDGELVLVHSWRKKDIVERLGLKDDWNGEPFSTSEFLSAKIFNEYTTLSIRDFLDLMQTHQDIFVMVDYGNKSYDETLKVYRKIVEKSNNNRQILNRILAGGQTPDMVRAARDAYPFPLINLYLAKEERRPSEIKEFADFLEYCIANDVTSISLAKDNYNSSQIKKVLKNDIEVFLFTIDDVSEANTILESNPEVVIGSNKLNSKTFTK